MVKTGRQIDTASIPDQAPVFMVAILIGYPGVQQQVTQKEIIGSGDRFAGGGANPVGRRLPG